MHQADKGAVQIVLGEVDATLLRELSRHPQVVHETVPVNRRSQGLRDHEEADGAGDRQADDTGPSPEDRPALST